MTKNDREFAENEEEDGIDGKLVNAIIAEMDRVWGDPGLGGDADEYAWLEENYGITEGEDVKWQFVLQYFVTHDLPEEDEEDPEVMDFLEDYEAVTDFLNSLLRKYQSGDRVYPRE